MSGGRSSFAARLFAWLKGAADEQRATAPHPNAAPTPAEERLAQEERAGGAETEDERATISRTWRW